MAKSKSIFDTPTSEKDIQSAAKKVQTKSIPSIPDKKGEPKPEKMAMIRISHDHKQRAKSTAAQRNMTLSKYIELLVATDNNM